MPRAHSRRSARNSAVAQIKGLPRLTGVLAWIIWIAVQVFSLLGNRNQFATTLNFSARYLIWRRSHKAIVGDTPTIIPGSGGAPRPCTLSSPT